MSFGDEERRKEWRRKKEEVNNDLPTRTSIVMPYIPIEKNCADCARIFEISSGEQDFFRRKGLDVPRRCKECRIKRKEIREKN